MENPTYHLQGVVKAKSDMEDFDGPLSLILMLLSKNKIAIRDIRISEILEQYLHFIDEAQRMDIEIASEFMQMASHLLYLKTRALLPSDDEGPDELEELMSSLEKLQSKEIYAQLKGVLQALSGAYSQGSLLFTKQREPVKVKTQYAYHHEPEELRRAMLPLLRREGEAWDQQSLSRLMPKPIIYSVVTKTKELIDLLRSRGSESLSTLFAACGSRSEIVATFLSILELCSAGSVQVTGEEDNLSVTFTGGDDAEQILNLLAE